MSEPDAIIKELRATLAQDEPLAARAIPATTLKQTHTYGSITQLIAGSACAETFAGGTFAHYMLPPSAYHRFHLPVSGLVRESFVIHGKVASIS